MSLSSKRRHATSSDKMLQLQRKANALVWRNIERLNDIASRDYKHDDLLAQLHPWREHPSLQFNNTLSFLCILATAFSGLSLLLFPILHIPILLGVLITLALAFLAYVLYQSPAPIIDAIERLEEDAIRSLYQLQHGQIPEQNVLPLRASMLMSQMQILFPIFQQGDLSNAIHGYAAAKWQGRNGQDYAVLVFHYHYVDKVEGRDREGERIKVREQHYDQWGVLVFGTKLQGLAVSNLGRLERPSFGQAYTEQWQTSDIDTNQKLSIYCSDAMQAAKSLGPAAVLGLNQLFSGHSGVWMCHPNQAVMCFLGKHNLLQHSQQRPKITDISQLRGHLRTFRLYPYEKLQQAMLALLP